MIPYGRQSIDEVDIDSVLACLKSDRITQGNAVPAFEQALADKVGAKYAVACSSGTAALHMACHWLLDGSTSKRVWTSPNSFLASANAPLHCGAKIDFVDIDPDTGLMNMVELEQKLEATPKSKWPDLVIPVHLAGNSCDMNRLMALSEMHDFAVLEDAAHALGGEYLDQPVGSCRFSNACVFSFHPVKSITTGEGGAVVTNNAVMAEHMRNFRNHGVTRDADRFRIEDQPPWAYEMHELGMNYRLTDLQASLGITQLKKLDSFVERRNEILGTYALMLKDNECVRLVMPPRHVRSAGHLAMIELLFDHEFANTYGNEHLIHRRFYDSMQRQGIGCQIHYIAIHTQPYYQALGFELEDFPYAAAWPESVLSIPCYPELSSDEIRQVVAAIAVATDESGLSGKPDATASAA